MAEKNDKEKPDMTEAISQHLTEKADKIKVVVIVAALVVAAAAVFFTMNSRSRKQRDEEGRKQLYQTVLDLGNKPETDGLPVIAKLAADNKGTPVGAQALTMKFGYAYNTRNYAEAEGAAREFLRDYPQHPLATRVQLALGQALVMQNKFPDAAAEFRRVIATGKPGVFPEAKLGLAQTLYLQAKAEKDNPEEYRRRLGEAQAEYTDIVSRARAEVAAMRAFWPGAVVLPASFDLVVIKDTLAGHAHEAPRGPDALLRSAGPDAINALTAPAEGAAAAETTVETVIDGDVAGEPAENVAGESVIVP